MDKPKFQKGDLVQWKHGTDVGVVVGFGHDMSRLQNRWSNKEFYALVHWLTGKETKVYEKENSWHGVIVIARAQEEKINEQR